MLDINNSLMVGEITFFDSMEVVQFTNPDEYLKEIRETLYYRGIHGWGWYTSKECPDLAVAVGRIISDEFF